MRPPSFITIAPQGLFFSHPLANGCTPAWAHEWGERNAIGPFVGYREHTFFWCPGSENMRGFWFHELGTAPAGTKPLSGEEMQLIGATPAADAQVRGILECAGYRNLVVYRERQAERQRQADEAERALIQDMRAHPEKYRVEEDAQGLHRKGRGKR